MHGDISLHDDAVLKIQDLKRYGIQALLIDNYSEITDIFKIINVSIKCG